MRSVDSITARESNETGSTQFPAITNGNCYETFPLTHSIQEKQSVNNFSEQVTVTRITNNHQRYSQQIMSNQTSKKYPCQILNLDVQSLDNKIEIVSVFLNEID